MKLSIRTRLAVSFSLLFTVLLIVFSGVIYSLMSSDLEKELIKDSNHDVLEVLHVFENGSWDEQIAEMPEESREFSLKIKVLNDQGKILYLTDGVKEWDWPTPISFLQTVKDKPLWSNEDIGGVSHLIRTQTFYPKKHAGLHYLQIANSREDINHIRNQLIFCINLGTPLILILTFFMGRWFAKFALSPVEKIRKRAENITSANLSERLTYDGPADELSSLTTTLNDMLSRIQRTFVQMKQFVADASHELRIPITGLRGTLEVALRQDRSQEDYKKALETVHRESERLSELVWDLLSLARADAGELKLEKSHVDLTVFMKSLFEEAEALNVSGAVHLKGGETAEGTVLMDEVKIHQVLINLIENAIRYNRPGGEVFISARMKDNNVVFSVQDTGIGIATEDQLKIFDRFYRVDKARSRDAGGTGLGLSIAKSIVEAHKGRISVKSELGQGSLFTVIIPVKST